MTINEAYKRVQLLDLREQVPVIIELTADEIIALNQLQLYSQSVDRDGDALGGYSTIQYEELKRGLNPQLDGLVDLYLTGDFYSGFFVKVEGDQFIIGSSDSKSGELENRYGKAIFGLTNESRALYIKTQFFTAVKNYIQGITKFPFQ